MKRSYADWMIEYEASHRHPVNRMIHKICVPLITLTIVGFMWLLPTPTFFQSIFFINWAHVFVLACLLFYLSLNFKMFLAMTIESVVLLWICAALAAQGVLFKFCLVVFVVAWIFQFYGHRKEGRKPSFFQDVVFLLIGPMWVLRSVGLFFRK